MPTTKLIHEPNVTGKYFLAVLLLFLPCIFTACATGGPRMYHIELSFDFFSTNRDMEVLDYQFGNTKRVMTQMATSYIIQDLGTQRLSAGEYIPKPEFVYVKWRNMETGEVFEERADLTGRLPDGLDDYEITFFVKGPQHYVYLISPIYDRRPADWPKGPIEGYYYLKQWELYPNPTDFSSVKLLHRSDFWR